MDKEKHVKDLGKIAKKIETFKRGKRYTNFNEFLMKSFLNKHTTQTMGKLMRNNGKTIPTSAVDSYMEGELSSNFDTQEKDEKKDQMELV